ncbi:MAG: nucleotidyl transferase AbiEii/AbiGii toxin family protein [Coprothermobacterota bacterium]|nr:nucleotidyl transferase AbiEii/AbiGii toxin family protein [Coprothermobacterota bacterium]
MSALRVPSMFTESDLKNLARKIGLNPFSLERDLVFVSLLLAIGGLPTAFRKLILKGGGALKRIYFPNWRQHENLRFSVEEKQSDRELISLIQNVLKKAEKETEIKFQYQESFREKRCFRVLVAYVGPLRRPTIITLLFSLGEPLFLSPCKEDVITDPFPLKPRKISTMALEEILAEKLRDFLLAGEPKDLYDAWRLLAEHFPILDREDFKRTLERKCQAAGFDLEGPQDFLDPELFVPTRAYWEIKLSEVVPTLPPFEEVYSQFKQLLPALLAS